MATLRGLSYPLRLDNKGGLKVSTDAKRIREQILEIITTKTGERVFRNEFGTDYFTFNSVTKGQIETSLTTSLQSQLSPDVGIKVNVDADDSGSFVAIIQWWTETIPAQDFVIDLDNLSGVI